MSVSLIIVLAVVGLAFVYAFVPPAMGTFIRYRPRLVVRCPETMLPADLQVDAVHAALTAIAGPPEVRVRDCSSWPDRRSCGQACVSDET